MPDGTTTPPQTKAVTSFLDALMARIAGVDLAQVTYPETDPEALEEIRTEAATGTLIGPMPDNLKRLWFLKNEIQKVLREKAESSIEHIGPLLTDAALQRVKGDDPRLTEVRERHRDMSNCLFERELIDKLYDRELVSAVPDQPHGTAVLVDPDFNLHVLPPKPPGDLWEKIMKEFGLEELSDVDVHEFDPRESGGFFARFFRRGR